MTTRSHSKSVVFSHPFELKGVDRILPAGDYRVVTDEELIEELSFPVYRRVATMIFVPAQSRSSVEMVTIDPRDLQAAQDRDVIRRAILTPWVGGSASKIDPVCAENVICIDLVTESLNVSADGRAAMFLPDAVGLAAQVE
jgi:hypothetical protein